ncbi:MAG TPA: ATP-dependent helicase [Candidatus Omnitrophota bacterium]|nr:ATP-dependent helicase [Candidatus Omnitrophota bacterium]
MPPTNTVQIPKQLNASQQQAVDYRDGHLLIVAGPGTGKTHTLTCRLTKFIEKLNEGQQMLAVTFTNKAAEEMQERLKKMIPDADRIVVAATFHGFCSKILTEFVHKTSFQEGFRVLDEDAQDEMIQHLWPSLKKKERKELLHKISMCKSVAFESEGWEELNAYNKRLKEANSFDYDDLILEALRLLEEERDVREILHKRHPYIFVDEYQDINAAQHKLLTLLVGFDNSLTAIGDPNQAIYGFRGSNVRFFQEFRNDFPGSRIFHLNENYRSAKNILSASSQVMAQSSLDVPAVTANIYNEGRLVVHACPSEKAEAEYVVHSIERLVGGTSMFSQDTSRVATDEDGQASFGDIAVLYRLNSQAHALKEAFERSGIPTNICGKENEEDDVCPTRGVDVMIDAEKVSLITLHASKGLEFGAVFIVGCEENILPLRLEGLSTEVEEERRLFYVGMTRAKERLYLTRAQKRMMFGKPMENPVSSFVLDIEERLKEIEQQPKFKKKKQEEQMSFL